MSGVGRTVHLLPVSVLSLDAVRIPRLRNLAGVALRQLLRSRVHQEGTATQDGRRKERWQTAERCIG